MVGDRLWEEELTRGRGRGPRGGEGGEGRREKGGQPHVQIEECGGGGTWGRGPGQGGKSHVGAGGGGGERGHVGAWPGHAGEAKRAGKKKKKVFRTEQRRLDT